jgi:hypothetical protein
MYKAGLAMSTDQKTDSGSWESKSAVSNRQLIGQSIFLLAITILATTILVCADMARSFRQSDTSAMQSGQAMYAAAADLKLLQKQFSTLNSERARLTQSYAEAVQNLESLGRVEYASRVQFRRILFQCYFNQYNKRVLENEKRPPEERLSVLSQRFLNQVYGDISQDPNVSNNCRDMPRVEVAKTDPTLDLERIEILSFPELDATSGQDSRALGPKFADKCASIPVASMGPVQAKECSYSNVMTYVSRHEGAKTRLTELSDFKKILDAQLKEVTTELTEHKILSQPAALEATRLLVSLMPAEDGQATSNNASGREKAKQDWVQALYGPIESCVDFVLRTLLTAPALALTILLSLTTGAVGGAYRSAWVKYSPDSDKVDFMGVKDSLLLGAFLGAAVGLLTWLGLMTTGAVVGGEEGPAANLDPKLLAAIAVAAGLANREAMHFLVTTAQQNRGQLKEKATK